jgi:small basic protein (TIGR04137 family)
MSVHKSLRQAKGATSNRSVLTRAERIAVLTKTGRLKPGDRVVGLPKVRVEKVVKKAKSKKKDEEAGAASAAPAAAAPAKK